MHTMCSVTILQKRSDDEVAPLAASNRNARIRILQSLRGTENENSLSGARTERARNSERGEAYKNPGELSKSDVGDEETSGGRFSSERRTVEWLEIVTSFRTERHGRSTYNREIELLVSVEVYIFSYGIR